MSRSPTASPSVSCGGDNPDPGDPDGPNTAPSPTDGDLPPYRPNCGNYANLDGYGKAWCDGQPPDSVPDLYGNLSQYAQLQQALDAIRAHGGPCVPLADAGQQLLSTPGGISIFTPVWPKQYLDRYKNPFGAGAPPIPQAPGSGYMVISSALFGGWSQTVNITQGGQPAGTVTRSLTEVLAHELDHLVNGSLHNDDAGYTTELSEQCSSSPIDPTSLRPMRLFKQLQ